MTSCTRRRLQWSLRARGPALDTWPSNERAAALDLLRTDPAARAILADALAAEEAPSPEPGAECRIRAHVRRALAPIPPVLRKIGIGAITACLLAGLWLGLAPEEPDHAAGPGFTMASSPAPALAALGQ